MKVIFATRKMFMEFDNNVWIKMDSYDGFSIPLGAGHSLILLVFTFCLNYCPSFQILLTILQAGRHLLAVKKFRNKKIDLYSKRFHRSSRISFSLYISIVNEHEYVNCFDVNINLITDTYEYFHKSFPF